MAETFFFIVLVLGAVPAAVLSCRVTLTGRTGSFESPNYFLDHLGDASCSWSIITTPGTYITLTIDDFDLTEDILTGCVDDHLTIYENLDSTFQLGRYCGTSYPDTVISGDHTLLVVLTSDSTLQSRGFSASYVTSTTVPASVNFLTGDTGNFNSENYPNDYPNWGISRWSITTAEGTFVRLTFNDFSLEDGDALYGRVYDHVTIYGNLDGTSQIGRFSGSDIPGPVQSTTNTLLVVLITDGEVTERGFSASYDTADVTTTTETAEPATATTTATTIASPTTATGTTTTTATTTTTTAAPETTTTAIVAALCGASLTDPTGSFVSPGYPDDFYPNDEHCEWSITTAPDTVVRLTFDYFNVEYDFDGSCKFDHVTIYENLDGTNMIGRYCGTFIPAEVLSTKNTMLVVFSSDYSITMSGFSASYDSDPVPCAPGCKNGGLCNGADCDCPVGSSGPLCETENSCKLYLNNELILFSGNHSTQTSSNQKRVLTNTPDLDSDCRFQTRAKLNGKGFVAMNFGLGIGRNKYAVSFTFNQQGIVREQGTGKSKGQTGDATVLADGYVWQKDGVTPLLQIKGITATGYEVTSLIGCDYRFQYFYEAQGGPTFVAYLTSGEYNTEGICGSS